MELDSWSLTDPTLASSLIWYPMKRFYIKWEDYSLYDYIHSAQCGGIFKYVFVFSFSFYRLTVEKDQMPEVDKLLHCSLPLHFWTNKQSLNHTTMHPMRLERISSTRNLDGSGNGGEYCWIHDKGQYNYFLTLLCHMWFGITKFWIQVIPWSQSSRHSSLWPVKWEVTIRCWRRFSIL